LAYNWCNILVDIFICFSDNVKKIANYSKRHLETFSNFTLRKSRKRRTQKVLGRRSPFLRSKNTNDFILMEAASSRRAKPPCIDKEFAMS
jgi:hypothetical protein